MAAASYSVKVFGWHIILGLVVRYEAVFSFTFSFVWSVIISNISARTVGS
jgi:hypothetical protein